MWIPRKRQPWVAWLQEQTRHHVMPQAQCDLCTALVLREKEASAGLWPASLVGKHSTWRGQKKPHYLWKCWTHGGCCLLLRSVFRGAGSLCLLNQKRISFESRTEAVLWYVWRGVKVDCRKKNSLEKMPVSAIQTALSNTSTRGWQAASFTSSFLTLFFGFI